MRVCLGCGATNIGEHKACLVCKRRLDVSHVLPDGGLPVWNAPDPSQPPLTTAAQGLEVTVVEVRDAWALVRFSNGWNGWLDGRRLVERSG